MNRNRLSPRVRVGTVDQDPAAVGGEDVVRVCVCVCLLGSNEWPALVRFPGKKRPHGSGKPLPNYHAHCHAGEQWFLLQKVLKGGHLMRALTFVGDSTGREGQQGASEKACSPRSKRLCQMANATARPF